MTVGDAKHVRSILAKNSPEPVQVKLYEGDNSVVYNGPLLEFER